MENIDIVANVDAVKILTFEPLIFDVG